MSDIKLNKNITAIFNGNYDVMLLDQSTKQTIILKKEEILKLIKLLQEQANDTTKA